MFNFWFKHGLNGSREKLGGVRVLLVLNFILFMQKS